MLAPLNTSRRGYTLVHMDYINVMPVVSFNSTKQCPAKLSSVTITAVYGGADQGFRRLARASGSLEKALLSHSEPPRAPPTLPFA